MMERPTTCLWEKEYKSNMRTWCRWNIEQSSIDNLQEFMTSFMHSERGRVNPQTIIDAWNEVKECT